MKTLVRGVSDLHEQVAVYLDMYQLMMEYAQLVILNKKKQIVILGL